MKNPFENGKKHVTTNTLTLMQCAVRILKNLTATASPVEHEHD
jgi:hypothetical protein